MDVGLDTNLNAQLRLCDIKASDSAHNGEGYLLQTGDLGFQTVLIHFSQRRNRNE